MKRIVVLLLFLSSLASAGPSAPVKLDRISGTVKAGLWVENASVTYATIPAAGGSLDTEQARSECMLVLLLDDVQGITENERRRMSDEFLLAMRHMPLVSQRFIEMNKWIESNRKYMLWISKGKEVDVKKIQIDTRVEFKGITYFADDWGGQAKCDQITTGPQGSGPPKMGQKHN